MNIEKLHPKLLQYVSMIAMWFVSFWSLRAVPMLVRRWCDNLTPPKLMGFSLHFYATNTAIRLDEN
jgi:hypothetical protein